MDNNGLKTEHLQVTGDTGPVRTKTCHEAPDTPDCANMANVSKA